MPSSRTPSKLDIETDQFAVIRDTERDYIVTSGRYSELVDLVEVFNSIYQSTAYRVERWIPHNKES